MNEYRLEEGSVQYQFFHARDKIQIMGGGFGNGKTTAGIIKALGVARDYPGANLLLARATYPKLNDTLRKDFLKWCPADWIASFSKADNTLVLVNGTTVNFRYVSQKGKEQGGTSNLLSATYDFILIDQMEDPEITAKDFDDLLGRLRGNTPYRGNDPTMPPNGPRWFIGLVNPSRNWVFRRIIKPIQDYKVGIINPNLIVNKNGEVLVGLYEGPTYINAANLAADYIETLEASYKGQMFERYVLGKWGAFEGLVYPQYDASVHMLDQDDLIQYVGDLVRRGYVPEVIEAYDHGIASPSCYLIGLSDHAGNDFIVDGFYEKEKTIKELAAMIQKIRNKLGSAFRMDMATSIFADPSVFRRTTGSSGKVGVTVAELFRDCGIKMRRANNEVLSGVAHIQSKLEISNSHRHPMTGLRPSPRLFFSNHLNFIDMEISDYLWKKDTDASSYKDEPQKTNDHAMDALKYYFTNRTKPAQSLPRAVDTDIRLMLWHVDDQEYSERISGTRVY